MSELSQVWLFVQSQPLIWLIVTIAAYLVALWINGLSGGAAWAHPVFIAMLLVIGVLVASSTEYHNYYESTELIHFLMGPAVVALAVPLYDHLGKVRSMLLPLLLGSAVGAVVAATSVVLIGMAFELPAEVLLSIAPKSVTSPIAIGIAEKIGGFPSLAAGLVLLTGGMGCMIAPYMFRWFKVKDPALKGYVLGVTAHAMGTAYAFEYGMLAGAFGGLAMGVTGAFTAFMLPALLSLLGIPILNG